MKVIDVRTIVATGDDQWYEMDVLEKSFFRARTVTYVLNWWKDRSGYWYKNWSVLDGTPIRSEDKRGQLGHLFEYYRVCERALTV